MPQIFSFEIPNSYFFFIYNNILMSSDTLSHVTLCWEWCPPELLWIIFKKLDIYSLLSCMIVNRRWKDIVIDFIEVHGLWPKIVSDKTNNRTLQRTYSVLGYKDMVTNSKLWAKVMVSQIELHHTYVLQDITKMHLYKDNLILKTDAAVRYYNIKDTKLMRFYESTSIEMDYTENDYIVIIYRQEGESTSELRLYGKSDPDDTSLNKQLMYIEDCVLLYRLEDNICYIVTHKYIVWALIWNGKIWDRKLRGRYYGNRYNEICAIHVINKRVSLVTKYGLVLCEDPKAQKFVKSVRHLCMLPSHCPQCMSASLDDQQVNVCNEIEIKLNLLQSPATTCYIEHEEILFVGFKDGRVAIYIPNFMRFDEGNRKRFLQVQDFDQSIEDPAILALGVYEDKMSMHLFVATKHKVFHLLFTYRYL